MRRLITFAIDIDAISWCQSATYWIADTHCRHRQADSLSLHQITALLEITQKCERQNANAMKMSRGNATTNVPATDECVPRGTNVEANVNAWRYRDEMQTNAMKRTAEVRGRASRTCLSSDRFHILFIIPSSSSYTHASRGQPQPQPLPAEHSHLASHFSASRSHFAWAAWGHYWWLIDIFSFSTFLIIDYAITDWHIDASLTLSRHISSPL
jgi:hypothetical protein